MPELEIREISDRNVDAVITLWQRCGLTRPWNDPAQDIAFARSGNNATILTAWQDGQLVGSAMVGHDGHRGTAYYVAVDPNRQTQGLGRALMQACENWLLERGVWKLNIIVRSDNSRVVDFYRAIGYEVEDRVLLGRWIDPEKSPKAEPQH